MNSGAGQARDPSDQARDPSEARDSSSAFWQCNFSTGATRQWRATRWVRRATRQRPPYKTACKFAKEPQIAKFCKVCLIEDKNGADGFE